MVERFDPFRWLINVGWSIGFVSFNFGVNRFGSSPFDPASIDISVTPNNGDNLDTEDPPQILIDGHIGAENDSGATWLLPTEAWPLTGYPHLTDTEHPLLEFLINISGLGSLNQYMTVWLSPEVFAEWMNTDNFPGGHTEPVQPDWHGVPFNSRAEYLVTTGEEAPAGILANYRPPIGSSSTVAYNNSVVVTAELADPETGTWEFVTTSL